MGKDKYLQKDTCIINASLHTSAESVEPKTPFIKRFVPQWVGKAFRCVVSKSDNFTRRRFMPRRQQEKPR